MRPTIVQRFFAYDAPTWIVLFIGTVGAPVWLATDLVAAFSFLRVALLLLVTALLGALLAIVTCALFLAPVYEARGVANGAPYREGDEVLILVGKHRGVIAKVYEVWHDRRGAGSCGRSGV